MDKNLCLGYITAGLIEILHIGIVFGDINQFYDGVTFILRCIFGLLLVIVY